MKKNKLGQRKIQTNLDPDILIPDTDIVKFGRHTFVIKRIRERGKPKYRVCVKGHTTILIEGDAPKEQLVLKLIDQHRTFFTLKARPQTVKYSFSPTTPTTPATSAATSPLHYECSGGFLVTDNTAADPATGNIFF